MAQVRKSRLDRPDSVGGGSIGRSGVVARSGKPVPNRMVNSAKGTPKEKVSSNVSIVKGQRNSSGVEQIRKQNALAAKSPTAAQAKTNARALNKAQGPSLASGKNLKQSKQNATERKKVEENANLNKLSYLSRKQKFAKAAQDVSKKR